MENTSGSPTQRQKQTYEKGYAESGNTSTNSCWNLLPRLKWGRFYCSKFVVDSNPVCRAVKPILNPLKKICQSPIKLELVFSKHASRNLRVTSLQRPKFFLHFFEQLNLYGKSMSAEDCDESAGRFYLTVGILSRLEQTP